MDTSLTYDRTYATCLACGYGWYGDDEIGLYWQCPNCKDGYSNVRYVNHYRQVVQFEDIPTSQPNRRKEPGA